jgi:hypothetical protein
VRGRLCQKLDRSASYPLALIAAPAGSGKTRLIAGWLTTPSQPAALVTLDEVDNTPARFWGYFTAALEKGFPLALDENRGDYRDVSAWASTEKRNIEDGLSDPTAVMILARWLIRRGLVDAAVQRLESLLGRLDQAKWAGNQMPVWILLSLAHDRLHHRARAMETLDRALRMGESGASCGLL